MIPADLIECWILTDWSLSRRDRPLHIALACYPLPACLDIARRYDAALAALEQRHAFGQPAKAPAKKKSKKRQPVEEAPASGAGQLELW